MEKKFEMTNVLFIFCMLIGITSLGIGVAFSYFRADIKGDKVNSIESSSIKLIYTEQSSQLTALIATDDYAIENSGYFNFSVKSESDGSTKLEYYVYIDEDSLKLDSDEILEDEFLLMSVYIVYINKFNHIILFMFSISFNYFSIFKLSNI